jgi:hypothetical protein
MVTAESLIAEALTLDEEQRLKIIDAISSSLEDVPGEPFNAASYGEIIERRIHELRSGRVVGIPLDELRAAWQPVK